MTASRVVPKLNLEMAGVTYEHVYKRYPGNVVITDLRLPDGDGMEILDETKRLSAGSPVIIITGRC